MYFYHLGKNTGSFSRSLEMVCDLRGSKSYVFFVRSSVRKGYAFFIMEVIKCLERAYLFCWQSL